MRPNVVLVIGSDAADSEALSKALEGSGLCIAAVQSYRAAILALSMERFAAVLCAEKLRDGDWKDVLSHTAIALEPPPFVLFAAAAGPELRSEAAEYGAFAVVEKPIDPLRLAHVIRIACAAVENFRTATTSH